MVLASLGPKQLVHWLRRICYIICLYKQKIDEEVASDPATGSAKSVGSCEDSPAEDTSAV